MKLTLDNFYEEVYIHCNWFKIQTISVAQQIENSINSDNISGFVSTWRIRFIHMQPLINNKY